MHSTIMIVPHHQSQQCKLQGQQAAFRMEVENQRRKCSACRVRRTFHSEVHQILKGRAKVNHTDQTQVLALSNTYGVT